MRRRVEVPKESHPIAQAVLFCIDNSDYARNEDTSRNTACGVPAPSRLEVQLEALRSFTNDLEEGCLISVMALAGPRGPDVKCYPTDDKVQVLTALDEISIAEGQAASHLYAGLRIGQMILQQRCPKATSRRMMVFVASPLQTQATALEFKGLEAFGRLHNLSVAFFTFAEVVPGNARGASVESFYKSLFSLGIRHEVVTTVQLYRVLTLERSMGGRYHLPTTGSTSVRLPPQPQLYPQLQQGLSSEQLTKLGIGIGASSFVGLRHCSREAMFPSRVRVRTAEVSTSNGSLVFYRKPSSRTEVFLKFNAGKLRLANGMLIPEQKKGQIVILKEPGGVYLKWFDRSNGRLGLAINLQGRSGAFERIDKCTTGRAYALTLSGISHQYFFWLQQHEEPSTPNGADFVSYCNQLLRHNTPLRQVRIYGSSDLSSLIKNYKRSYFLSVVMQPLNRKLVPVRPPIPDSRPSATLPPSNSNNSNSDLISNGSGGNCPPSLARATSLQSPRATLLSLVTNTNAMAVRQQQLQSSATPTPPVPAPSWTSKLEALPPSVTGSPSSRRGFHKQPSLDETGSISAPTTPFSSPSGSRIGSESPCSAGWKDLKGKQLELAEVVREVVALDDETQQLSSTSSCASLEEEHANPTTSESSTTTTTLAGRDSGGMGQ